MVELSENPPIFTPLRLISPIFYLEYYKGLKYYMRASKITRNLKRVNYSSYGRFFRKIHVIFTWKSRVQVIRILPPLFSVLGYLGHLLDANRVSEELKLISCEWFREPIRKLKVGRDIFQFYLLCRNSFPYLLLPDINIFSLGVELVVFRKSNYSLIIAIYNYSYLLPLEGLS